MSEFDVDIRAVSSASYGARLSASDINQAAASSQDASTNTSTASQSLDSSGLDTTPAGQASFRYDSFRFLYKSDFGRIVLVDQNPQTGAQVSQIPSQRALQLYAEQKQAELRTALATPSGGQGGGTTGSGSHGTSGSHSGRTSTGSGVSGVSGTAAAVTAAQTTPQVSIPSPAYIPQTLPPVNITI